MPEIVRAALVQSRWTGDKQSMVEANVELARQAAAQGAKVACFQEIFSGPISARSRTRPTSPWPSRSPTAPPSN